MHSVRDSKAMVRRILDSQSTDDAATRALFADAFALPDFDEGVAAFPRQAKAGVLNRVWTPPGLRIGNTILKLTHFFDATDGPRVEGFAPGLRYITLRVLHR